MTEEGERYVYGEFEDGSEVRGNGIDQGEEVDHRVQQMWPLSTYRRC